MALENPKEIIDSDNDGCGDTININDCVGSPVLLREVLNASLKSVIPIKLYQHSYRFGHVNISYLEMYPMVPKLHVLLDLD